MARSRLYEKAGNRFTAHDAVVVCVYINKKPPSLGDGNKYIMSVMPATWRETVSELLHHRRPNKIWCNHVEVLRCYFPDYTYVEDKDESDLRLEFRKPFAHLETDSLRSCVFDIETITRNPFNEPVPDSIATISINFCLASRIVDTVFLTVRQSKDVTEWIETPPPLVLNDDFSARYRHLITVQYRRPDNPVPVNVIVCEDERAIVKTFVALMLLTKPHNTVTFYGESFDWPFLIRAGFRYDYSVAEELSPIRVATASFPGTSRILRARFRLSHHDTGMIDKHVLDLQHNSLLPYIHTDLHKYEPVSLNAACKKRLGEEKLDLPYRLIPDKLWNRDELLMKYNVQDTDITSRLFFHMYFVSVTYYTTLEQLTGAPWDHCCSGHQTAPAHFTYYCNNRRHNFVQMGVLKPRRILHEKLFLEIARYFLVAKCRTPLANLEYPESRQFLSDFHNGCLSYRKVVRPLRKVALPSAMDGSAVQRLVGAQLDGRGPHVPYTSIDLVCMCYFLTMDGLDVMNDSLRPFVTDLLNMFVFKHTNLSKMVEAKRLEEAKFIELVRYLVTTYKYLSPYQHADIVWKHYVKHYNSFPGRLQVLKMYYFARLVRPSSNEFTPEFYAALMETKLRLRPRGFGEDGERIVRRHILEYVTCVRKRSIEHVPLPYAGALIMPPVLGITLKHPVVCFDIVSSYPWSIVHLNLGPQTEVSLDYVRRHGLIGSDDLKSINLRREDDERDFTVYLDRYPDGSMDDYVRDNYVFFLGKHEAPIISDYRRSIDYRLTLKRSIRRAETQIERKRIEEMSDTLKRLINSFYGALGLVIGKYHLQPATTSRARLSVHVIKDVLKRIYGREGMIRYGDSVIGSTPLLLRKNGRKLTVRRIEDLFLRRADECTTRPDGKDQVELNGFETWTEQGWTTVQRVIRHELAPANACYLVKTSQGVVVVTGDHSLLKAGSGEEVSAKDVTMTTELMHSFPGGDDFVDDDGPVPMVTFQSDAAAAVELTTELAHLLGLILRHGHPRTTRHRGKFYLTVPVELPDECFRRFFSTDLTWEKRDVRYYVPRGDASEIKRLKLHLFRDGLSSEIPEKRVPGFILNAPARFRDAFLSGVCGKPHGTAVQFGIIGIKGRVDAAPELALELYTLVRSLNGTVDMHKSAAAEPFKLEMKLTRVVGGECWQTNPSCPVGIGFWPHRERYVYDLTTDNHHFQAGIGSLIVHNTDSVFFSLNRPYGDLLNLSPDEAVAYFNGTCPDGMERVITRDQVVDIYARLDRTKSAVHQGCTLVQEIFEKGLLPLLNAALPDVIGLELEKTLLPFIQKRMKKYVGYKPLDDEILTKGMSGASRNALKMTIRLLNAFVDQIKQLGEQFSLVDYYHYVGREVLTKLKSHTMELELISRSVSYNLTKTVRGKAANMIARYRRDQGDILLDTFKANVVIVEPVAGDVNWSVVTTDEFRRPDSPYRLHVEKNMLEVMSEMTDLLSTSYTVDECVPFEAMRRGYYDPDLERIEPGHGRYVPLNSLTSATLKKRLAGKRIRSVFAILRDDAVKRARNKMKVLPANIALKGKRKWYEDSSSSAAAAVVVDDDDDDDDDDGGDHQRDEDEDEYWMMLGEDVS